MTRTTKLFLCGTLALGTAVGSLAVAPSVAYAQQVAARDVVRLKSGAVYSGTISELVPNVSVEIVLITGVIKRFDMADVEFAGPLPSGAPQPVQVVPTAPGATVSFNAQGDGERITLHEVTGTSTALIYTNRGFGAAIGHSFRSLCSAPCEASLEPGTRELALSRGDGLPVIASRVEIPPGTSGLSGSYESRSGTRFAGWLVLLGGTALGSVLTIMPFISPHQTCQPSVVQGFAPICSNDYDLTWLWVGLGVMTTSTVAGLVMILQRDQARLELVPGAPAALNRMPRMFGKEGGVATGVGLNPGLSLRLTF